MASIVCHVLPGNTGAGGVCHVFFQEAGHVELVGERDKVLALLGLPRVQYGLHLLVPLGELRVLHQLVQVEEYAVPGRFFGVWEQEVVLPAEADI